MRTDNERMGLKGNGRGMRDQAGVTENQVGVVGWDGGVTQGAIEGECGCGFSTKDKADLGYTYPSWRIIRHL